MKKRLFLLLAVASVGWAAWAAEPEVMAVYLLSGGTQTWALGEVQEITFNGEDGMVVHALSGESQPIVLDNVEKIIFIVSGNIPSAAEESILPTDAGTRKVWENGQIVIIKDGKRYNLLGAQI